MIDFDPPQSPPPFLTEAQLHNLITQGHVGITLPPNLSTLCQELFHSSSEFFARPQAEKRADYPKAQVTELGFYEVANEKEFLTLRHKGPFSTALESSASHLWSQAGALLHRILFDIGRALQISEDAWNPIIEGCLDMPDSLENATSTLLRMLHYVPGTGIAETHSDMGLITLCVGAGKGLQAWQFDDADGSGEEGKWIDCERPTVLVGRTLRLLSAWRVRAGVHRVIGNPDGRDSIVFPLRMNTRNQIPLAPFGGWGSVAGKDLYGKVRNGRININAEKDIREKQRLEQKKQLNNQERVSSSKGMG